MAYDDSYLKDIYQRYLGRDPDPSAQGWLTALQSGAMTEQDVLAGIRGSEEFQSYAPQVVSGYYENILERPRSEGEGQSWIDALTGGGMTPEQMQTAFYGSDEYKSRATAGAEPTTVDIPTDKYPKATSGLDTKWRDQIMEVLFPEMAKSIRDYEANVKKREEGSVKLYQNMINQALKQGLQQKITELSRRRILGGTEAGNIMSKTARDVILGGAGKGYEAAAQTGDIMSRAPQTLGGVAELARHTTQTDESVPYRTIATLLQGLM
jgi:hypothetical protein